MATPQTKGQGWKAIPTQWRKASDIVNSILAAFLKDRVENGEVKGCVKETVQPWGHTGMVIDQLNVALRVVKWYTEQWESWLHSSRVTSNEWHAATYQLTSDQPQHNHYKQATTQTLMCPHQLYSLQTTQRSTRLCRLKISSMEWKWRHGKG